MRHLICTIAVLATLGTASAQTPQFNPTDIGVGTNSAAQAINASGTVVGYWVHDLGAAAFLYQSNQVYEITALGTNCNVALALNDAGQVVGYSWFTNGYAAFHYDGTNVINLGDWSGTNSYATGINASNRISGFTETTNSVLGIYFDGQPYDIGSFGGNTTYAYGLNATGTIVGASTTTNRELHAFLQDGSGIQDLNALFPDSGVTLTIARAINSDGSIVGTAISNEINQPFLISDTNLTIIPLIAGSTNGYAFAINNANAVVGACETESGKRAFLWKDETLYDLNDCATNANWVFREASGINDAGQIVGWGNVNGEVHAFLLTPNQAPSVTITSPTNNASFVSPFDLTITATATDDVEVTKVEFYVDGQLIGTKTEAPYTVTWPDVCAGNYVLTAIAYDNLGVSTTSAPVTNNVALPEAAYLKCWLKPESLASYTQGAPVTSWPDSSGHGYNATASSTNTAPMLLTNQVNGFPAVKFDGTNDALSMSAFMYQATAGEAFIILKAGTKSTDPFWQICSSDSSSYNTTSFMDSFGCASSYQNLGPNSRAASFALYNPSAGGGVWHGRVNGFLQWTGYPSNYFTTSYCLLGARRNTYATYTYGSPSIVEFIVFNKKLTTDQRNSINKHLLRKYQPNTNSPATPTTLVANAVGTNRVSLTWSYTLTNQWTGFKIERKTTGAFSEVTRVENTTAWFDTTVSPGETYTYRVKAYTPAGDGEFSNEATTTVDSSGIAAPFSSLRYWLSADYGYPVNGANYWMDRTGGPNNWAFNTALIQNFANGMPAVRFNGSNAYVQLATSSSTTASELFIVLKNQSVSKKCGLLNWGTDSFYPEASGTIRDGFNATTARTVSSIPVNVTTTHIYNSVSASTSKTSSFNGIPFSTYTNTLPTSSSGAYLGRTIVGTSYYFDGYIMEVLVFNRALTLDERFVIGKYLNDKYAIVTNAPGTLTNVNCTAISQQQLRLSWNATANTAFYQLERKLGEEDYQTLALLDSRTNQYTDTIQSSDPLWYRVTAHNYVTNNTIELLTPLAPITSPMEDHAQFVGQNITISLQPNTDPFRVNLYADGALYHSWTNETCDATFLSSVPRHWGFIALITDGFGNSRYSAPLNIDFIYPSATDLENLPDSDGDGLPDYIEDFITTNPNDQDTDADGMPDWWEIWYGLNPRRDIGRDGASGDFDNDGISNLQEYLDGTNPADGLNGGTSSTALQVHRPN